MFAWQVAGRCPIHTKCMLRNTKSTLRYPNHLITGPDLDLSCYFLQVVGWSRKQFCREISLDRRDESIYLGKACLLIALEEEAAIEMHPELESELRGVEVGCEKH